MSTTKTTLLSGTSAVSLGTGLVIGLACFIAGGGVSAFANGAGDWVGVAAAIRGDVALISERMEPHRPRSGERLFLGDRVTSGDNAHLQILLRDKTVFTLGEDCDLTIDRFVYDPASKSGEIRASVTKGAFRFVTGEIPHRDPEALTIAIPAGTIGVRGTIGEAVVGEAAIAIAEGSGLDVTGANPQNAVLVVLRGPGQNLNTGDRIGQVTVAAGGEAVVLARPNWASFVAAATGAPSPAFEIPAALQGLLSEALRPRSGAQSAEEGEDSEDGGSQGGSSQGSEESSEGTGMASPANGEDSGSGSDAGSVSADAGQDTAAGSDLASFQFGAEEAQLAGSVGTEPDTTDAPLTNGPTRPNEFLARNGTATYESLNVALSDGTDYDYYATVNFDTRQWTGSAFFTAISFSGAVLVDSTVDLSGDVISRSTTETYGPGQSATLNEVILNRNGETAAAIQHNLTVTDTNIPSTATGSGIAPQGP